MHDRLVNEVAMVERHARFIGCTLASADTSRRWVNAWRKRCLRTIQGEAMHDRLVNEVAAFLKV